MKRVDGGEHFRVRAICMTPSTASTANQTKRDRPKHPADACRTATLKRNNPTIIAIVIGTT